jgi:glycosyltransferase involved in cell wall biosynthesis
MGAEVGQATVAAAPLLYGAGIQNKVLEAMACGTPVVATSQATAALAAEPGRDLLVAEGAPALARALLSLLDSPEERERMGRAGRAFVEEHHSWPGAAARFEALYAGEAG